MTSDKGNSLRAFGNNNQQQHGDGNTIGNNNNNTTINNFMAPENELTETEIYSLLTIVGTSNIDDNNALSLKEPSELNKKLHYNHAPRYKHKFEMYTVEYGKLDKVIKDFSNSQKIIRKLKTLFINVAEFDDSDDFIVSDGDNQLDQIKDELHHLIVCDPRFVSGNYTEEDIDTFILALLTYSTAKCNVLINPN